MIRLLINGNVDLRNFQFQSHGVQTKKTKKKYLWDGDEIVRSYPFHMIFAIDHNITCSSVTLCGSSEICLQFHLLFQREFIDRSQK